jgi:hypothetical protein
VVVLTRIEVLTVELKRRSVHVEPPPLVALSDNFPDSAERLLASLVNLAVEQRLCRG